jgi:methionine aminotransferase
MKIESKLPDVGVSIFARMTQLANEQGAINLSQGFPDFETPPALVELVAQKMRAGHNQYAPLAGVERLREQIALKVKWQYDTVYDPATEITVTPGATEAIFCAVAAVVRPGDEVIIIEPAYDAYAPDVRLAGGRPVFVPMPPPGYRVDWQRVKDAMGPHTRLLMINSPHNPMGTMLDAGDIAALTEIVASSNTLILSDEVYEHIIYDGRRHESMAGYPQLARRSFVISSFGKSFHTTGWKIGYCLAPAALTAELRRVHQFVTFCANNAVQEAYADFMADLSWFEQLAAFYQQKRDLFVSLLAESRFHLLPCQGTYYQMLSYADISDAAEMAFARELAMVYKVAAIPPSAFYAAGDDHRLLRFCFAKNDDTLRAAAERLCRI